MNKINEIDYLIIGSGLSGAVVANKLAEKNFKVKILEKRNHIAGNVYDEKINGITKHVYGPHVFHTQNERVKKYMDKFWNLNSLQLKTKCFVKDKIVPIPFNFEGIDTFFPKKSELVKQKFKNNYPNLKKIPILELLNGDDVDLKEIAKFIYKNIFENYTTKMWGKNPREIDPSVTARVPISLSYDERYFVDKYEGVPKHGYTTAIEKMIDSPNIEIELNVDASRLIKFKNKEIYFKDQKFNGCVIYCGPIDELFSYEYGVLPYRSLDIKFEEHNKNSIQGCPVVNYPNHPTKTRQVEYKYLTLEKVDNFTIISKEYPGEFAVDSKRFNIPYYPMATDDARKKYNKYLKKLDGIKNFHLLGRLATFKYINMDQTILYALEFIDRLFEGD